MLLSRVQVGFDVCPTAVRHRRMSAVEWGPTPHRSSRDWGVSPSVLPRMPERAAVTTSDYGRLFAATNAGQVFREAQASLFPDDIFGMDRRFYGLDSSAGFPAFWGSWVPAPAGTAVTLNCRVGS